MFKTNTYMR